MVSPSDRSKEIVISLMREWVDIWVQFLCLI